MRLEFENGLLRIENTQGRRWQVPNSEKPRLSFAYDALIVNNERALRRLGAGVHPLAEKEVAEVVAFVDAQEPPASATIQKQFAADLKVFGYGLISSIVTGLGYDNLLDVQITGREGSTDLYAAEARRVLEFMDLVWNSYDGLVAQINATPEAELKPFRDYANMMPMPPKLDHFRLGPSATGGSAVKAEAPPIATTVGAALQNAEPEAAKSNGHDGCRPALVEKAEPEDVDFTSILDRALVFDGFFPATQLHTLEQWALQTPHWMLTNSTYNEKGAALHRIWGASYIEPWKRHGWRGLPPVLFATFATLFQRLNVTITEPEYIGLNGQSHGQTASIHTDCDHDSGDDLSILVYLGEDTDGDLLLYDKGDRARLLHRIPFRPNRVIAFDGSIPHQALAPTDDKFRMSIIIRGKYEGRRTDLLASNEVTN